MEAILVLLVLGLFFSPVIAVFIFRKKLNHLEDRYQILESRLARLEEGMDTPTQEPFSEAFSFEESFSEEAATGVDIQKPSTPPPLQSNSAFVTPHKRRRLFPVLLKLERQFLDNWTGVLGAVIIVLGAGFLSIYAALKMEEFARFLLLLLLSAIPGALFLFLREREGWQRQAAWFRSISGAVFLFACLGSGGIPGLQWIHNPFQSLGLLILGIAVNLGLSLLGGKEYFASFHTLLSLLALAVIPPGTASLFIAVVICLFAIIQTYRIRWDLHLLLTVSGFSAYHLHWMTTLQGAGFTDLVRYQGAGAVVLIFTAAAMIHYRKNYASGKFELFPFLVHLVNWSYFIAGMILYTGESRLRTIPLVLAALGAMLLASHAGKLGIGWLRTSDYMIMQILFVTSLLTLRGWDVRSVLIWGLVFAESALFIRIMLLQNQYLLYRIGCHIGYISGAVLMATVLDLPGAELEIVLVPAAALMLNLFNHRTMVNHKEKRWIKGDTLLFLDRLKREFSLTGFMTGLLGMTVVIMLNELELKAIFVYPIMTILLSLQLLSRMQTPSRGLNWGAVFFITLCHIACWDELLSSPGTQLLLAVGFCSLVSGAVGVYTLNEAGKRMKGSTYAWILITGSVLAFTYALLNPISPLFPGIVWLLLSSGLALSGKIPAQVSTLGLIFFGAYLVRHFSVHIHMTGLWKGIPQNYLMDVLVLPVFFLWYRQRTHLAGKKVTSFMPLLLEAPLLFSVVILFLEVSPVWIPFFLEVLAVLLVLAGQPRESLSRLRLYSLFINWAAIAVLIAGVLMNPDNPVFPLAGAFSMVTGLGYLILIYKYAGLDRMVFPGVVQFLVKIPGRIAGVFPALILYPLFIGCAVFILGAASSSFRTFFWALECFLVYGVSLFLREEHFRYVSQGGLLFCVVRLILVDLSGSTVLIRGLVFLGVGAMMLGVNVLYNRYKERFRKESR